MHSSLAVTTDGLPLGMVAVKFWNRKKFKGTAVLKSWDPRGAGALTRKELGVLAAHVGLRHVVGVSAACRRSMNSVA